MKALFVCIDSHGTTRQFEGKRDTPVVEIRREHRRLFGKDCIAVVNEIPMVHGKPCASGGLSR